MQGCGMKEAKPKKGKGCCCLIFRKHRSVVHGRDVLYKRYVSILVFLKRYFFTYLFAVSSCRRKGHYIVLYGCGVQVVERDMIRFRQD